jgi:hypothetical protein
MKEKLRRLLTRGNLTAKERAAFEDMWDAVHRYGKLSSKQKAWIERVYFGQGLDRSDHVQRAKAPKTLVCYAKVKRPLRATSLKAARELLPKMEKGSNLDNRIKDHFEAGGEFFVLKPKATET